MKSINRFVKTGIVFFLGNVLSKLVIFLMLPIYTAYITPNNYGYYDLTITYISLFTYTVFLGIWNGVMRFLIDYNNQDDKEKVICSSFLIFFISSLLFAIIGIVVNSFYPIKYFLWVLFYGYAVTFQFMLGYIARGYGHNALFAFSGIISSVVMVIMNLFLIVLFKTSYWALYASSILGILVQLFLIEKKICIRKCLVKKNYDKFITNQIFKFCLPLSCNFSAIWVLQSFSRIYIAAKLGEEQNGYLAMAFKFSAAISLVGSCFSFAWQELSFHKNSNNSDSSDFYSEASIMYYKFICLGICLMIPISSIIFNMMINPVYNLSKNLIPLSLISTGLSMFSGFWGDAFLAMKKTSVIFVSVLVSCVISIASLVVLLPIYGTNAASISIIIGYSINIFIRMFILKKTLFLRIKPIILISILLIPAISLEWYLFYCNNIVNIMVTLIVLSIASYLFKDIIISLGKNKKIIKGE